MELEPGGWLGDLVSGVFELRDPGASISTLRRYPPRVLGSKSLHFSSHQAYSSSKTFFHHATEHAANRLLVF